MLAKIQNEFLQCHIINEFYSKCIVDWLCCFILAALVTVW